MKPLKPSQKNKKQASKLPVRYIVAAVGIAVAVTVVITVIISMSSRAGSNAVNEAEAQSRWKESVPAKKK